MWMVRACVHVCWCPSPGAEILSETYTKYVGPYKKSNRLVLVDDGESPIPKLTFRLAPGHTPGHSIIEVSVLNRPPLVACGDAWALQVSKAFDHIHTFTHICEHQMDIFRTDTYWLNLFLRVVSSSRPALLYFSFFIFSSSPRSSLSLKPLQGEYPDIGFAFEVDKQQAAQTRKTLYQLISTHGYLVLSYHEIFPGLGYFNTNDANSGARWIVAPIDELQTDITAHCDWATADC